MDFYDLKELGLKISFKFNLYISMIYYGILIEIAFE